MGRFNFEERAMRKYFMSPLFTPVFVMISWLLFMNIVLLFFPEAKFTITEDGNLVEQLTHTGYVLMLLGLLVCYRDFWQQKLSYAIFIMLGVCAFLREAGIQHHLSTTDTTPFKSRFFLNPQNPLSEKIVFGLVLLLVFGAVIYLAIKYTKYLIVSFFKMNTVTWSVATMCTILVVSKFFDRFPSNYRHSHEHPLSRQMINSFSLLEESIEIFLPYIVIIALWQYHQQIKNR